MTVGRTAIVSTHAENALVLQPGFCVTSAGRQSSMVTQTDVQAWADGLDGVVDRIAAVWTGRAAAAGAGLSTGLAGAGGAQERLAVGRSGGRCDPRWGAALPEPGAVGCRCGAR